jgi:mediator of RNA polymerase II transcription subunit 22
MSKVGAAAGSATGPTAAAAAAAVQKQKSLLQNADADVSSLVDNFSSLINIARVRPRALLSPLLLPAAQKHSD